MTIDSLSITFGNEAVRGNIFEKIGAAMGPFCATHVSPGLNATHDVNKNKALEQNM